MPIDPRAAALPSCRGDALAAEAAARESLAVARQLFLSNDDEVFLRMLRCATLPTCDLPTFLVRPLAPHQPIWTTRSCCACCVTSDMPLQNVHFDDASRTTCCFAPARSGRSANLHSNCALQPVIQYLHDHSRHTIADEHDTYDQQKIS